MTLPPDNQQKEPPKFHNEDIDALHENIRMKYDVMMEEKRKLQNKRK